MSGDRRRPSPRLREERWTTTSAPGEADWRAKLTPEQFRVLRGHGTERAGSSPLNAEKRPGRFRCAGCGAELFDAATKFDSGTGWPSFWAPLDDAVATAATAACS